MPLFLLMQLASLVAYGALTVAGLCGVDWPRPVWAFLGWLVPFVLLSLGHTLAKSP